MPEETSHARFENARNKPNKSRYRQSRDGYKYRIDDDLWKVSLNVSINFKVTRSLCSEDFLEASKLVISWYVDNTSSSHAYSMLNHLIHFLKWHLSELGICSKIDSIKVLNYKSSLSAKNGWYLSKLRVLLIKWSQLGYDNIEDRIEDSIRIWRISGNPKGVAVRQRSTTDGAFSELELEAITVGLVDGFRNGQIALEGFTLIQLFVATGRRGIQVSHIICSDLTVADETEKDFFLNCPRAKQRRGGFRKDFKAIYLSSETGMVVATLVRENMQRLRQMGRTAQQLADRLPLFPDWRAVSMAANQPMLDVPKDFLHLPSDVLAKMLSNAIRNLEVISERTGERLKVTTRRFRRTTGTRAAEEGVSELVIAELLDHADTQNVRIYTENVPEHAEAINRAVAWQIAPIAQAFTGKVVDREADAIRGDDPTSRVRTDNGKTAGTCGQHGFCGARPPIACYTCSDFQPWLHGPHEEVLDDLIAEEEALSRQLGPGRIASINNRTIVAVSRVIQLCDVRKRSIQGGAEHVL